MGVSLNQRDGFECTPIHIAARTGNIDLLVVYLSYSVDINIIGFNGWYLIIENRTALHEAASYAHVNIVRWLIYKGADESLPNGTGETPRDLVKKIGYADSVIDEMFSMNQLILAHASEEEVNVFKTKEESIKNAIRLSQISDSVKTISIEESQPGPRNRKASKSTKFPTLSFLNRNPSSN